MTKRKIPIVCDDDSCSTGETPARKASAARAHGAGPLEIEVFSDYVCPWCPIGERRLEKALEALDLPARVTFRPFELNPGHPREGVDRKKYLAQKFGSVANYERMSAQLALVAKGEGLTFAFDKIEKSPNTRDAHRLAWFAEKVGKQPAVVERLFHAYFTKGEDLGDHGVLRRVAAEAGLEAERVDALLASDEGLAEVVEQERRAHLLGIDGVPCIVVDGEPVISGAQPPEIMAEILREVLAAKTSK
ncbi:MAG TPA: DsbA family oxidoreductase [Planctomycetota bacterium]|nr:DsbA family oxidoreductase [Planctomycetota bacterium]